MNMFNFLSRSFKGALLCSIFFAIQTASAAITPRIDASRVSGVAPLSVFFDASATTSTATGKPFHELHYAWDFGDTNAGDWQYGNPGRKDKNLATGPVAAHVFETPGTYTVRLTTKGLDGVTVSKSINVTVQNPDSVFSGNNTTCFSSTGNYTSCPSGARHVTTSSFQTAMAYATAGKRLLFRRGESWTASGGSQINNDGPGLVGAFGNGDRPAIHNTSSDDLIQLSRGSSGHTNDWRIMDLDISSSNYDSEMFRADNTVNNLLLLRLKGRNFYRFISIAANVLDYYGSSIHKNLFVVDNDFEGSASHGSYVAAEGLVYMGNRLKDSPNSHVLRITYANPLVIANNSFLGGSGPSHHLLKFHSLSPGADNFNYNHSSSGQFVISDNIVDHGSQGDWAFALGPQSSSGDRPENVRTGIIERNHFISGANTQTFIMLWTSEVTARNNLFDQTGSSQAIQISRRNQEDAPHDNSVHNNTFYSAESGSSVKAVIVDSIATNTTVRNNLLYTNSGSGSVLSGSATQSNNLVMAGLSQNNTSRFLPVGNAIDGANIAMVIDDYDNVLRPLSAQDIGAYESNGGTEPPAPPSPIVSLGASPSAISSGSSSTLSWSTTNANSCIASGGWSGSKSTSGTQTVSPASSTSYTLSCSGEGGSASDNVTVSVSPQADTTSPTIPTNLTASSITQNSITISWNASTDNIGVTGYKIYRDGSPVATSHNTSSTITGLSPDTTYQLRISAEDAAGNASSQSAQLSVTTLDASTPPPPTVSISASPSAITAGGLSTLAWNASNVDRCTASGGWSGLKSTSGTQTVSPASNTRYTLSCTGAGGSVSDNVTISIIPQADTESPSTPVNVRASSITQSSATLLWNASTDNVSVTGYRIFWNGTLVAETQNTSFGFSGLSSDTTYRLTVSAIDAVGNESNHSSTVSVTTLSASGGGGGGEETTAYFSNWQGSDGYTAGSGQNIALVVNDQEIDSVTFQVWSGARGVEASYTVSTPPYVYESSALDTVTPGAGKYVQALLRVSSGRIAHTVSERTVFAAASPVVSLTASRSAVAAGGSSILSWSTKNASSCTASGGWSGSKNTSGSETVSQSSKTSYTLTCKGAGGSASETVTIMDLGTLLMPIIQFLLK